MESKKSFFKRTPLPPPPLEFDQPWRPVTWNDEREKDLMLEKVKKFQLRIAHISQLRILLDGPVGAGKSSFINSISNALRGCNTAAALASSSGLSFTLKYKTHRFKKDLPGSYYPFVFNDIMGMETGSIQGVHSDDIIRILKGHIKEGYTFNPVSSITKEKDKEYYNISPSLNDKVHCLVSVIPANSISLISEDVIKKLQTVRDKARDLGIPQVIVMSMVDKACTIVQGDLTKVYHSKKIKEKMQECSNRLGVPMNYIFPVQNYYEQITNNINMDILLLMAITDIITFANDYVEDQAYTE
ncbi:interferon-induced protein 44-like [Brachyhypopomus gauderio]|uniref:interferon-induced protein 44-like n=1 Tax=Brachyhypopomus gauderio TaxID=698409 RepID=UPI0040433F0B